MSLNISFENDVLKTTMPLDAAEKFVVSYKLQQYIKHLNKERQKIIEEGLKNNTPVQEQLHDLDEKIADANNKMEKMIDIGK